MKHTLFSSIEKKAAKNIDLTGLSDFDNHRTNEFFIGIVAPIGAGPSTVARILEASFIDKKFEVETIEVSKLIYQFAKERRKPIPNYPESNKKTLEYVEMMQNAGDAIRKGEIYKLPRNYSRVAHLVVREIVKRRAILQDENFTEGKLIVPNGKKRVFIVDSLRNPAESGFLKAIYGESYFLLGVVCDAKVRKDRFIKKMRNNSEEEPEFDDTVSKILKRDEDAKEKFGQKVSASFQVADYFVNNSQNCDFPEETGLSGDIDRFVNLITKIGKIYPTIYEEAMYQAHVAKLGSACLSRQVGASLINKLGIIVSTGKNDVPMPGGGLYQDTKVDSKNKDGRCAYYNPNSEGKMYCRNTSVQQEIINEIIDKVSDEFNIEDKVTLRKILEDTPLTGLLEFSRAIHAEMDAIISANLAGVSTVGCRMCVTTYPCHSCARHIVASGIIEVVYIEPYPKSKAIDLHDDSITASPEDWEAPISSDVRGLDANEFTSLRSVSNGNLGQLSKTSNKKITGDVKSNQNRGKIEKDANRRVLFHPFAGVAPSLYPKVFLKERDLKHKKEGWMFNIESNLYNNVSNFDSPYFELELKFTSVPEYDKTIQKKQSKPKESKTILGS